MTTVVVASLPKIGAPGTALDHFAIESQQSGLSPLAPRGKVTDR